VTRLGVLGTGSWGTALAVHWAEAGHDVTLWGRSAELVRSLEDARVNARYLPDVAIPPGLRLTSELADLAEIDTVIVVVPSHGFREVVRSYLQGVPRSRAKVLVSATKGIENDTLARMSEVTFEEAVAADREARFAVLSGPSFALELAAGTPTLAVVAADDGDLAAELRETLSTRSFRLYSSTDVVGVELGGTSKNVVAIAAGIVTGLGLGSNTLAAVLTRGLHEITRLGLACGGQTRTLAGLAGMGDLVLTCTGALSRNRHVGMELAAGKTLEEISAATPMIAEGVRSSLAVARIAERRGVEMPITEEVVRILYHGKSPRQTVHDLMTRDLRSEAEL
jgi:glycerol-3-phosphate dehydrogenase (NAD(P)+)